MNKERLEEIKSRVSIIGKYKEFDKAVSTMILTKDVPALIAEVERLREDYEATEDLFRRTNEELGYEQEENARLREALEFHLKVLTMVLGGEVVLMQKSKDKIRIPKSVADAIELFKRSGYDNNEIMEKRYGFSHNGYLIAVLKRVTPAQLYDALTNGYEVTKNE